MLPKHLFYNNREIIAIGDSDVRPAIVEQATALTLDQVLPTLQIFKRQTQTNLKTCSFMFWYTKPQKKKQRNTEFSSLIHVQSWLIILLVRSLKVVLSDAFSWSDADVSINEIRPDRLAMDLRINEWYIFKPSRLRKVRCVSGDPYETDVRGVIISKAKISMMINIPFALQTKQKE